MSNRIIYPPFLQPSGKNILSIGPSGYYTMPFPFGNGYSSVTVGLQATFEITGDSLGIGSASGYCLSETAPYGIGAATGFYLSLFYSNNFSTTYLPFQNSTVPSLGVSSVKTASYPGWFLSGTVGLSAPLGLVGYDLDFHLYVAQGQNTTIISQPAGNTYFQFVETLKPSGFNTFLKSSFDKIGHTGQMYTFWYQQNRNLNYPNIQSLLQDSIKNDNTSLYFATGYWTTGFSSGGGPLPLPNAFATYNPYIENNLSIYNIMLNSGFDIGY